MLIGSLVLVLKIVHCDRSSQNSLIEKKKKNKKKKERKKHNNNPRNNNRVSCHLMRIDCIIGRIWLQVMEFADIIFQNYLLKWRFHCHGITKSRRSSPDMERVHLSSLEMIPIRLKVSNHFDDPSPNLLYRV